MITRQLVRFICIAVLLLQGQRSFAQNDYDSLRKYSYYVLGLYDNYENGELVSRGRITGTGYFIRYEGRLFFFTARHVLTATDESCQQMIPSTDPGNMGITLVNESGIMTADTLGIHVKQLRGSTACDYLQNLPDLVAYEITDTSSRTIYSIEKFLPAYLPEQKGKIITFGYRDSISTEDNSPIARESIPLTANIYTFHNNYKYYRGKLNGTDSINYLITVKDPLFPIREIQGHSGSPAFIKDNKRNTYVFFGTLVGMSYITSNLSFVKPAYIVRTMIGMIK